MYLSKESEAIPSDGPGESFICQYQSSKLLVTMPLVQPVSGTGRFTCSSSLNYLCYFSSCCNGQEEHMTSGRCLKVVLNRFPIFAAW